MTTTTAPIWKGNPALQPFLYPLEHLVLDPNNANEHNERSIEGIKKSYLAYGQQDLISINDQLRVLSGNGQVRACRELGWTHIGVVVFDNANEALQKAWALAANRTAEHSTWNNNLGVQLAELHALGFEMEDMGFTTAEMEALSANWNVEPIDTGELPEHTEDGKHGMIKVEKVDLGLREDVRATVERALREAGYLYEVKAL